MEEEFGIVCVNVKKAWCFVGDHNDLDVWETISKKYDVDIRFFGIEMGQCFTQEVIIIRGHRPIVNEKQYADWMWECPFPMMGG